MTANRRIFLNIVATYGRRGYVMEGLREFVTQEERRSCARQDGLLRNKGCFVAQGGCGV